MSEEILHLDSKPEELFKLAKAISEQNRESLRDQFAMAALTGLLSMDAVEGGDPDMPELYSSIAYDVADAMLEARKK